MNEYIVLDEFELPVRFNEHDVVGGSLKDCEAWLNYTFDCHEDMNGSVFYILHTQSRGKVSMHGWCKRHGLSYEGVCEYCQRYQPIEILIADPPWTFEVWNQDTGSGKSPSVHYPCLTLEEMKKIDVLQVCAKNCALFLWATGPLLKEAIELGEAWGFTFKNIAFTWVKECKSSNKDFFGMGYYTRANPEPVLLFTRGKPLKRVSRSVRNLQRHKIGRHSEKPRAIQDEVHRLFGERPSMELFARKKYRNWECLGNEIDGLDIRQALANYAAELPR